MTITTPPCLWFDQVGRNDKAVAGGKAANLGDMASANLPVPPGFVITTAAYNHLMAAHGMEEKISALLEDVDYEDNAALQYISSQIQNLFDRVLLDSELSDEFVSFYEQLGDNVTVAVRSSATAEDTQYASFAGQQKTLLNVTGPRELLRAIKDCWASLYSPHVIFYRHQQGYDGVKVAMGVVIQKMLDVEKAGVLFTVDPIMKNHFNMMIEAVWGLGEGLVSGQITPDSYKIDRDTFEVVHKYVSRQRIMIAYSDFGGIAEVPVPSEFSEAQVLTEAQLEELVNLGQQVEEHFGGPQDIEWGIEDEVLYLLQSRPITNL